ncbi:hypothetical protein MUK42_09351 [Musa troglodytarum]|uniref:Uncharacterized protein n=1 Tax=Musa troglodytarum TaxID=320322 RepID=A0A9E7EAP7_9LILI|nr:hypothetical protein MUK42_09351 [Musa troglodytarum]
MTDAVQSKFLFQVGHIASNNRLMPLFLKEMFSGPRHGKSIQSMDTRFCHQTKPIGKLDVELTRWFHVRDCHVRLHCQRKCVSFYYFRLVSVILIENVG